MQSDRPAGTPTHDRRTFILVAAIVAVVVAVALFYIALGLLTASTTLGCDYSSYSGAARRFLDGQPIYLPGPARTGACPLFPYPPPFVLIVLPFVLVGSAGMWLWIGTAIAAFALGTAILPVAKWIRLAIFLLGAIGWPLIFGVRIGQVVPLLYLLFALGWRCVDRPGILGATSAIGAMIKVQPGLAILWMVAARRWRALAAAVATAAALAVAAAAIGLADWPEFIRTIVHISSAIDVPANLSVGATAFRLGLSFEAASIAQVANSIAVVGITVYAGLRLPAAPGFLIAATASQILSPIVWSHYALILLLPVAWLVHERQKWALLIPVIHAWMLISTVPEWSYPLSFYVILGAVVIVGRRQGRVSAGVPTMTA
ncbi:MAG TPA: glycosyltransferase 87 family protein [Patescibacteria group bacterium]|nr:glycosyltransferase 87 family protein [Patescibacteria group bacterium]